MAEPSSPAGFIGRGRELELLGDSLRSAGGGLGSVAVVGGEPGVGKTRLLSEFVAQAEAGGWRVLRGCAYDTEGMPAYLPFIEALQAYVRACPLDELRSQLGDGASDVAVLVRELRRRLPELAPSVDAAIERYHLFESIGQFLSAISADAPSGLVLFLDDLHWADPATLLLCQHLARRVAGDRFLIVAAYRTKEVERSPALLELLAELARDDTGCRIALARLSPEETADLAATLTGVRPAAAVARAVYEQTQGNAFFASEVIRQLRESSADLGDAQLAEASWPISEGVRQVIAKRLLHLEAGTRQVLQAASVLGERFSLDVLPSLPDLAPADLETALEDATSAGMLRQESDGYSFAHPLIRRAIYEQLSLPQRRALHLAAAAAVEAIAGDDVQQLSVLAHHLHAGGSAEHARLADVAMRAGDRAAAVFAFDDAARMYGLAVEALQHRPAGSENDELGGIHLKRGRAFAAISKWPDARSEFEAALPLLPAEQVRERAELLIDLAIACLWSNNTTIGQRHAASAMALAEQVQDADLVTGAMAANARLQFSDGEIDAAAASYRAAIQRSGGRRVETLDKLLPAYAHLLYLTGSHEAAIEESRRCIEVGTDANDFSTVVQAQGDLGLALAATGRYDAALQVLAEAQITGQRHGMNAFLARARGMLTGPYIDLFQYQRAEEVAEEARDFARSIGFQSAVVSAGIDLLFIYANTGGMGKAEALLSQVQADAANAADVHGWLWQLRLAQARAQLALARGDWDAASEAAVESANLAHAKKRAKYEVAAFAAHGRALLGAGKKREALQNLRQAVALARPADDPSLFLRAASPLLEVEPNAAVATEARAAVERIRTNLANAELRGRFEDAEPVRLALSLGRAPATGRKSLPDGLSTREAEVLALVAAGKSNQQIADELVISLNTVTHHMSSILGKTGSANRTEAAAYAHRYDLT